MKYQFAMQHYNPFALSLILVAAYVILMGSNGFSEEKVKVFILAGQSNMQGKIKDKTLQHQVLHSENKQKYAHLVEQEEIRTRRDVWIQFFERSGYLTHGFGSPGRTGPELELGHVLGEHYSEPVLLIKTAWGGKSLQVDFRPPSSGLPEDEAIQLLKARLNKKADNPLTTRDVEKVYGAYYRLMIEAIEDSLEEIRKIDLFDDTEGYELCGFFWFQGWNDLIDKTAMNEYPTHLAHLVQDVRSDLSSPDLPFFVVKAGFPVAEVRQADEFRKQQDKLKDSPVYDDHVILVDTERYWDTQAQALYEQSWTSEIHKMHQRGEISSLELELRREKFSEYGSDRPYHYLGSPHTILGIGRALAEAYLLNQEH